MTIEYSTVEGKCLTEVTGTLTIYTAQESKQGLLKALEECQELELDLSQVSEFDTAGFQLLILLKREAEKSNIKFNILEQSVCVRKVFNQYFMTEMLEPVFTEQQSQLSPQGEQL